MQPNSHEQYFEIDTVPKFVQLSEMNDTFDPMAENFFKRTTSETRADFKSNDVENLPPGPTGAKHVMEIAIVPEKQMEKAEEIPGFDETMNSEEQMINNLATDFRKLCIFGEQPNKISRSQIEDDLREGKMKIFKSLNCVLCETPFARIANQPRSPRHLWCGLAMCHECFEREWLLEKEQRIHQCDLGDRCFSNPHFAYYLIDVLSQESLTLSPMQPGYLLRKPFKHPKCPICLEEYSITLEGKSPYYLYCGHIICTGCYLETRTLNEGSKKETWKYRVRCPICNRCTLFNFDKLKDLLQDILAELPEMTLQLEEMDKTKYRFCRECNKLDTVNEMFYCNECTMKICGTCAYKSHRAHKAITLLEMEACEMSEELQKLSINEVQTYQDLFPHLHKELVDGIGIFGTKLLSKEENLKKAPKFEDLQKKQEECIKLKTDFETICEKYMPHLRECDTQVKDLIKSFGDDTN